MGAGWLPFASTCTALTGLYLCGGIRYDTYDVLSSVRDTNIGSIDHDSRIAVYDRLRRLSSPDAGFGPNQRTIPERNHERLYVGHVV